MSHGTQEGRRVFDERAGFAWTEAGSQEIWRTACECGNDFGAAARDEASGGRKRRARQGRYALRDGVGVRDVCGPGPAWAIYQCDADGASESGGCQLDRENAHSQEWLCDKFKRRGVIKAGPLFSLARGVGRDAG